MSPVILVGLCGGSGRGRRVGGGGGGQGGAWYWGRVKRVRLWRL